MTHLTNNTKSYHAKRKPIFSEHYNELKHNDKVTDQCKQRVSLCQIGLVKDHVGKFAATTARILF